MGPPISVWPNSQLGPLPFASDTSAETKFTCENYRKNQCFFVKFVDNCRVLCLNVTVAVILVQFLLSLSVVHAGPVLFSPEYLRGPVTIARNIRHLPCISRRTGQEGVCMFAIDCLKGNGTHLGTCIDRFYFGSCCQIPDKTILPQIIGNNIEDNSIESSNFVHPHIDDKDNLNRISDNVHRKPTTSTKAPEKVTEANIEVRQTTAATDAESKTEAGTTLDNKLIDEENKLTTSLSHDDTVKDVEVSSKLPFTDATTELPIKLSTFQTVSGDSVSAVTKRPNIEESAQVSTETAKLTTLSILTTQSEPTTTFKPKPIPTIPSRRPTRPTNKPRPTFKPTTTARPQSFNSSTRPKPTNTFNGTRYPPYRPPPKRPTTKKPFPIPPRLNITILPQQSTSSRPLFTRPSTATTITYINTTVSTTTEERPTTTSTSTTTTTTTTTTTPPPTTTTTVSTTTTSEKTTTDPSTENIPTLTEAAITERIEPVTSSSATTVSEPSSTIAEPVKETIVVSTEAAIEKDTLKPSTEADVPTSSEMPLTSSSEFPPGLVTWSNTVDTVTKAPEKNATEPQETWSPITPPEGWILISTIPPRPETPATVETTSATTETTSATTETATAETITETVPTTLTTNEPVTNTPMITTIATTESTANQSAVETSAPSESETNQEIATTIQVTTAEVTTNIPTTEGSTPSSSIEFTVNVTLTPWSTAATPVMSTMSANDSAVEGSTVGSEVIVNVTDGTSDVTTPSSVNVTSTQAPSTTEAYNMSDYKDVCGRRLWPEARIVGGAKSGFGRWPWQISLRQWRTSTYLHKCGAALLNENWAITAAHCVEHVPPSELLVRLGEHDLANEEEPYGFAERRVQIVASHPHFDPATFEYDLALLRFYEPVQFQPNILPVCVPDNDDHYVGKTAHVTGWGRLYDEGPLPSVLQEVEVPIINNTACEAMYQAAGYNEHIPNIFICAGLRRGGSDSCEGDSGGPMVIQRDRDKRFVLGGVISWGIGCAEPNQPGVYTRISEFRDWINQILQF